MANSIPCGSLTCVYLLSFGWLFVAALWLRGNGRSPTGVVERGVGSLPGQPDRIANRALGRLTETQPHCGQRGVQDSDIPGLEGYDRQFEAAIEKIRLSYQGSRGLGGR
jgi:hypothetical protein